MDIFYKDAQKSGGSGCFNNEDVRDSVGKGKRRNTPIFPFLLFLCMYISIYFRFIYQRVIFPEN